VRTRLSDAGLLRRARVAQHIAHVVPLGPGAVGASEVLTRHQRPDVVLLTTDEATPLQFRMDAFVDLRAGAVVGETTSVFSGDFAYSFAMAAMRSSWP